MKHKIIKASIYFLFGCGILISFIYGNADYMTFFGLMGMSILLLY